MQSQPKPHEHMWVKAGAEWMKCEHCGAVKQDPKVRQRELQESVAMNKFERNWE